jgi:hypothetical protein
MSVLKPNSKLNDHQLKTERVVFEIAITSHATPASKVHTSDLPSVCFLRTEGKTAEVDALETVTWTTAADNSTGDSAFGVFLKDLGNVQKVLKIAVVEQTALATSLAVTRAGTRGLTAAGNIAFNIAGTGLNLASESPVITVEVEYLLSK